jgi:peptidoglycan/xylan/chitin deacetylase (PgdA/CDA1 family)
MQSLDLIKNRFLMRSASLSILRMAHIMSRYGLDNQRLRSILWEYVGLCNTHHVIPTLPVTGSVLKRCQSVFRDLQQKMDVELAVHGYRHIDYTVFSLDHFKQHLSQAVQLFHDCRIPVSGFRFPFLRGDEARVRILASFGFQWDSSRAYFWDIPMWNGISEKRREAYRRIGDSYRFVLSGSDAPIPESRDGFTEIPVSLPDDDMLLERLGTPIRRFPVMIESMVERLETSKGILVLQMHPERFPFFKNVLDAVLTSIGSNPRIWTAPLNEVSSWWNEKNRARWSLVSTRRGHYRLSVQSTDRVQVLIKDVTPLQRLKPFEGKWFILPEKQWKFQSARKPVIGVHPAIADTVSKILFDEGWFYEVSPRSEKYGVYLDSRFTSNNKMIREVIQRRADSSPFPLLRFWKWPGPYRCCVSITGDIDAIDIQDYLVRYHG